MNCPTCERNLSAYIDDELTTDVRLEIAAHLDECATCHREFEAHQAAWEAAGLAPAGQAPEELWQAVEAELQPREEGGATTLEDLALMLRGLAGEMRDLRHTVDGLRREIEQGNGPRSARPTRTSGCLPGPLPRAGSGPDRSSRISEGVPKTKKER